MHYATKEHVYQQDVMVKKLIKCAGILNFTGQLLLALPQTCEAAQSH